MFADVEGWNSSTFEYLWNKYANNTQFREPIDITPFEVRVSQLSYIGPNIKSDYFLPLPWMKIINPDSSMISIQDNIVSIADFMDYKNRILNSVEIDLIRYNFLIKYYNQNLIDIQTGLTYNRIEAKTGFDLPNDNDNWAGSPQEVAGDFQFNPIIESAGIRTTLTWKPTLYFQFTSGAFLGYSVGTLYKSEGGNRYLWGAGNRWNLTMSSAFVVEDKDKNFNYVFGAGFESGSVTLNKLNDNKYQISPITRLEMYTYGWNFSVGVQYGGRRTMGDNGFRRIVEDDYIGAIERLGQFVRLNPEHSKITDANNLIKECEKRISLQAYTEGMDALSKNDYSNAGYWLKQAYDSKEENIKTLAKFQLDKIASTLLDSVRNNLDYLILSNAEKLVLKAKSYSNEFSQEADILRGEIYLTMGDLLLNKGQYGRSLEKYQEAVFVSKDLYFLVNEKEKTLAKAYLNDANKGYELGELLFIIESLKQSQYLNPKTDSEFDKLITFLEKLK
jgi:hypothetical protein